MVIPNWANCSWVYFKESVKPIVS